MLKNVRKDFFLFFFNENFISNNYTALRNSVMQQCHFNKLTWIKRETDRDLIRGAERGRVFIIAAIGKDTDCPDGVLMI